MSINYVNGDLFQFIDGKEDIVIPHVVNDVGAWGAGFVIPLGQTFPEAKKSYMDWKASEDFKLGEILIKEVGEKIHVAHMLAQTLGGQRPLYYNHLARCMDEVANYIGSRPERCKIVAPLFSSGLAGGDWNFTEMLVEDCWIKQGIDTTICYLPQFLPKGWTPPNANR